MPKEPLNQYYLLLESCLEKLGHSAHASREALEGQWNIFQGSASIWIDIWHEQMDNIQYFQLMSPIMRVPEARKLELFQELLSQNDRLLHVSFSLHKDTVWLRCIREIKDLDESEILSAIKHICHYADQFDDYFLSKYGPDLKVKEVEGSNLHGSRAPLEI